MFFVEPDNYGRVQGRQLIELPQKDLHSKVFKLRKMVYCKLQVSNILPPLNLSNFQGFELKIEGKGLTLNLEYPVNKNFRIERISLDI